jgi:mRNA interferase MazF
MPIARRGEIWLIDLGYTAKMRPALVLSVAFEDRERAIVTYVPRTTALRGTRFEVGHRSPGFDPGAFDAQGIGGVPEVKLVRKLGIADATTVLAVEEAVRRWLGLA